MVDFYETKVGEARGKNINVDPEFFFQSIINCPSFCFYQHLSVSKNQPMYNPSHILPISPISPNNQHDVGPI